MWHQAFARVEDSLLCAPCVERESLTSIDRRCVPLRVGSGTACSACADETVPLYKCSLSGHHFAALPPRPSDASSMKLCTDECAGDSCPFAHAPLVLTVWLRDAVRAARATTPLVVRSRRRKDLVVRPSHTSTISPEKEKVAPPPSSALNFARALPRHLLFADSSGEEEEENDGDEEEDDDDDADTGEEATSYSASKASPRRGLPWPGLTEAVMREADALPTVWGPLPAKYRNLAAVDDENEVSPTKMEMLAYHLQQQQQQQQHQQQLQLQHLFLCNNFVTPQQWQERLLPLADNVPNSSGRTFFPAADYSMRSAFEEAQRWALHNQIGHAQALELHKRVVTPAKPSQRGPVKLRRDDFSNSGWD
tara:strand:- start:978 stop:2072 length:1095 start_codon:yes stop_codon:yes gene_type:complete